MVVLFSPLHSFDNWSGLIKAVSQAETSAGSTPLADEYRATSAKRQVE